MASLRDRIGHEHPLFVNGKSKDAEGYIRLTSKAWGVNQNRREHAVVMEQKLGRSLHKDEIVHHINGIRTDNRPENLEIMKRKDHPRLHGFGSLMKCVDCGKERWYGPALKAMLKAAEYKCRQCRFGKTW